MLWFCLHTVFIRISAQPRATNPFTNVTISDIELGENSLIDLSNNEIEIRVKLVLRRDFPEVGVFFSVLYGNLVFLYTSSRFVSK